MGSFTKALVVPVYSCTVQKAGKLLAAGSPGARSRRVYRNNWAMLAHSANPEAVDDVQTSVPGEAEDAEAEVRQLVRGMVHAGTKASVPA